jgi:hypothetical protein
MRDVVTGFYIDVLKRLIAAGTVTTSDSVLVSAARSTKE